MKVLLSMRFSIAFAGVIFWCGPALALSDFDWRFARGDVNRFSLVSLQCPSTSDGMLEAVTSKDDGAKVRIRLQHTAGKPSLLEFAVASPKSSFTTAFKAAIDDRGRLDRITFGSDSWSEEEVRSLVPKALIVNAFCAVTSAEQKRLRTIMRENNLRIDGVKN